LDLEGGHPAGVGLLEPDAIRRGIHVGRGVVERHGEGRRRQHEVHPVDGAEILEHVVPEARLGRLRRVVGPQLAVEIAVGGEDR